MFWGCTVPSPTVPDPLDLDPVGGPLDIDLEQTKGRTKEAIEDQWQSQAVSSTHLSAVEFNPALGKGRVSFDKGAIYEYDNCTQQEYDIICGAASAGAAFRATWGNGQKPYRRLQ